jgi:hypothetical protein
MWDFNKLKFRCKTWGFRGGDYEEFCTLKCDSAWLLYEQTYWKESIRSIIRVRWITEQGTTLAVSNNSSTLCTIFLSCVFQLIVSANAIPISLIIFIQMMKAVRSSEMYVLIRNTRSHNSKDGILQRIWLDGSTREPLMNCTSLKTFVLHTVY